MKLSLIKNIIAAVAVAAASSAAIADEDTPVRLWGASSTVNAYHGFLFLGNPLGFYEKEGVKVEFGTAAGSSATLQLLATNQVQMGYVGMDALILAKANNPDLPIKAAYLQDRGNIYEIVVPTESDIKTVKDLEGQSIGVANLASGAIPKLKAVLTEAGLDPNKAVGLIPVGNGAQAAAALRTGRVQALSLFRAQHALIETLGYEFRYFSKDTPSAVIAVNTDWLADNKDQAAAILRGVAQSSAFAQANPKATVEEFWELFGRSQGAEEEKALKDAMHVLSSTAKLWKDHTDDSIQWGAMDDEAWTGMQDALIDAKLMSERVDNATLYTSELIDMLNPVDLSHALELAASRE
ncbi:ABC transporter substrate-binding protein [Sulfitobacter sp. F26204]|uniref:ABC transporter substrate-binding protein n=1 Tax=Sulfitobacter sp. F26204 TaxID=2996014 RepID=UPI00225E123C|nr:ABC transporter substrate-binding protein [Sulfitobacter sp. F26204]MCX7561456.1 ABC transporter substrate-binding protein [Sulfitobacter sp. F26204]